MAVQSDEWRFRLFDAVASFLRRVTDRLPLVIVLDDLHWADLWHRLQDGSLGGHVGAGLASSRRPHGAALVPAGRRRAGVLPALRGPLPGRSARDGADRLDPTKTFRYFFVAGSSHTMVGSPAAFSQNSVNPLDWIGREVDDDPDWVSVEP